MPSLRRVGSRIDKVHDLVAREVVEHADREPEPYEANKRCGEFVYFAHVAELGKVKIGTSKNPTRRMSGIKRDVGGREVTLVGVLDGGRLIEGLMHERFASHRLNPKAEWFTEAVLPEARELIELDVAFYGEAA